MADNSSSGIAIILFGCMICVAFGLLLVRLYREVYFYEGVRLGSRIHRWLYNRWAAQYDAEKLKSQARDAESLVLPLLKKLREGRTGVPEVRVLDVATGTGRLPLALLEDPEFAGAVIGLDISVGMLERAARKLAPHTSRAVLIQHAAMPLPFPENTFQVVSCLESLELMPATAALLTEFARVLQPGGVLVLSRNTGTWGLRGKICPPEEFETLLHAAGFIRIEIMPWWKWFDLVWARKPGQLNSGERQELTEVLCCPSCSLPALVKQAPLTLGCQNCGREISISGGGIILAGRDH